MTAWRAERRRDVRSGGVRLAVREWPGDGPPILLLHGLASTSHIFDLVAPRLAPPFRVVAYDQRGHGESGKPGAGYGFDHTAGDALEVIRALRLRRPVLVGHSWGGNVALEAAVRAPRRVAATILIDGGFVRLRDDMDWPTARKRLAPPQLAGMRVEDFLAMVRTMFEGTIEITPEVESGVMALMHVSADGRIRPRLSRRNHMRILRALWEHDPVVLLERGPAPVLALATREANPAPGERAFHEAKVRAAAQIRSIGGHVRFEWIDGIHDVPIQRPRAVASRIERFVREATVREIPTDA